MLGNSIRRFALAATALVAVGALAAPALAQRGHVFGQRSGGFSLGPRFGGLGGGPGGFPGGGPGGPRGHGGGALGADVLTPAASFLGIPVDTLTADLKSGKTLAQEATAKGKTAADLITAVVAAEKKVFDAEVAAGWITTAQETSLVSHATDEITALVNNGPPVPGTGGPKGDLLSSAATFLGMTATDLQTALKSGKTLADEATAKGKTVADLVTALEAPLKTRLDAQVTAGTITQAQETAILAETTSHLTDLVNGKAPAGHTTAALRKAVAKYALGLKLTLRHI